MVQSFPFLCLWMFYFYCLALIALEFTDTKNSTGASAVVQWIMSVKITSWSSEYTNRMCYGDTWGSFSLGIFLLAAPVGRFIMSGLRVEKQRRRGSSRCGREGGSSGLPAGKFAFTCFLFFLLKNKGICRLLTEGTESIKQRAGSCRHMSEE